MSKNYVVENNRMTSGLCELSGITGKYIDVFSEFCGSQPL